VTHNAAQPSTAAGSPPDSGTSTIRIATVTKQRLHALAREGETLGDVVQRVSADAPTDNETTRGRAKVTAYVREFLLPGFGDEDETGPGDQLWDALAAMQHREHVPLAPVGVVLDNTALALLVDTTASAQPTRRRLAQLLATQPHFSQKQRPREIYVPSQALHLADVQHAGSRLTNIVQELELDVVPFGLDDCIAARRLPSNVPIAGIHVINVAGPTKEWPLGRPVLTRVPQIYHGFSIQLHPLQ
jgi:hypothetical protein